MKRSAFIRANSDHIMIFHFMNIVRVEISACLHKSVIFTPPTPSSVHKSAIITPPTPSSAPGAHLLLAPHL